MLPRFLGREAEDRALGHAHSSNDLVTIPGGDHTIAGDENDGFVDAILGSLTAVARLHQNTPNAKVNPFDNGHLTVNLLCNPELSVRERGSRQPTVRSGPARCPSA